MLAEEGSTCVTAERYRYEWLAIFSEKWESRRRTGAYKDSLNLFSQLSLKRSGECGEYAKVVYQTLPVMMAELLSKERRRLRFTRFRARARNLQEMARTVAYGAEQKKLRKAKLRGKAKRQLKNSKHTYDNGEHV